MSKYLLRLRIMNTSNITSTLMKQASCLQTLSSVCAKRQSILSSADADLYGKRFATSSMVCNTKSNNDTVDESHTVNRRLSSSPGPGNEPKRLRSDSTSLPEEPTDCCMSGCANCVWIQYAEDLKKKFCTSDQDARDIILSKITDPNMKMFLSFELDNLADECKWRPQKDDNIT